MKEALLLLDEPKRLEEAIRKIHLEDTSNAELYMDWKDDGEKYWFLWATNSHAYR